MGFFSSLADSATSILGKVINNAGTIANAWGAVAKIAGAFAATTAEEEFLATHGDPLVTLHKNYLKANQGLLDMAKDSVAGFETTAAAPPEYDQSVSGLMSGVWIQPTVTATGEPGVDQYRDIAKFLTLNGIPNTLTGNDDTNYDVANTIAEGLFAEAPPAYDVAATGKDDLITTLPFTIDGPGYQIRAKHVYYDLPLGQAAPSSAWHGAVHVEMKSTKDVLLDYYTKHSKGSVLAAADALTATESGGARWILTVQIDWLSAEFASQVFPKSSNYWKKNYSEYTVLMNSLIGPSQTMKVVGPVGTAPAAIKKTIVSVSNKLVEMTPIIKKQEFDAAPPEVSITSMSAST